MVAGVRFELTTFGLCDLTQLSLRVGLYLHPEERDARHPVSTPSSIFRGLVRYCPSRTAGLRFHRLRRVIFPYIAVRTPILPKRDLTYRSRSAGYELDEQTISPIDSVALTPMRHPKDPQKGPVLDPSWTLKLGSPGSASFPPAARFLNRRGYSLNSWWTNEIAIDPSPTAEATRLTLPPRTSPAAKTPGRLVSSR